jgi:hypothetical protein
MKTHLVRIGNSQTIAIPRRLLAFSLRDENRNELCFAVGETQHQPASLSLRLQELQYPSQGDVDAVGVVVQLVR